MGFESADDSEQVKNKIIFVVFGVDLRIHGGFLMDARKAGHNSRGKHLYDKNGIKMV